MQIAILGFGVEGKSAYEYLKKLNPKYEIDVYDENNIKDDNVKITKVKNFLDINFGKYGAIVRSPGVGPPFLPNEGKPPFEDLYHKIRYDHGDSHDFNLTSATQIFFDKCPAPIIGITGTKGKGTIVSFVAEILRAAGKKVHLVGNIGVAALDILPEVSESDVVVYELSSFQLWDLSKSPHVAVVNMIEPDHLEVHPDFTDYVMAKMNILFWQDKKDFAIIHQGAWQTMGEEYQKHSGISLKERKLEAKIQFFPDDGLRDLAQNRLPGEHNVENAEAAILAVRAFDPEVTDEQIRTGLNNFTGLPHRLKFVAEKRGVKYYDDSIATTPGSAIAAIKSFSEPKILILGGFDKGADYSEIGEVAAKHKVKHIFAIGANAQKVKDQVGKKFDGKITLLSDKKISDIVNKIALQAKQGDVVIMSPAAASFDMFKNYKDRGEQFVSAVKSLSSD